MLRMQSSLSGLLARQLVFTELSPRFSVRFEMIFRILDQLGVVSNVTFNCSRFQRSVQAG